MLSRQLLSDLLWIIAFLIGLPASAPDVGPVYRELTAFTAEGSSAVAALVDEHGQISVFASGRGADEPVPLGSVRKWFTAALVLMLVDEGTLSLDAPIASVLSPWKTPLRDQITLRQLLSHTSGLVRRPPPGSCSGAITLAACVDTISAVPLLSLPGERFRYSSAGFNVAARVAEQATGQRWEVLLEQRLFAPLGMTRTEARPAGPGLPEMVGEIWSTPEDFARFLRMLLECSAMAACLLSREAVIEMERSQLGDIPRTALTAELAMGGGDYGLGVWRSEVDARGDSVLASAHGKGGFLAWVDHRTGRAGVLSVRGRLSDSGPVLEGPMARALMKRLSRRTEVSSRRAR